MKRLHPIRCLSIERFYACFDELRGQSWLFQQFEECLTLSYIGLKGGRLRLLKPAGD